MTGFRITDGRAEVGYLILPRYHGQGLGSESLKALITWASEEQGIHSFDAIVTQGNIGSEKVLTKNGFSLKRSYRKRIRLVGSGTQTISTVTNIRHDNENGFATHGIVTMRCVKP